MSLAKKIKKIFLKKEKSKNLSKIDFKVGDFVDENKNARNIEIYKDGEFSHSIPAIVFDEEETKRMFEEIEKGNKN